MDYLKMFIDVLVKGTPWAVLIAGVGVVWQIFYSYSRDRFQNKRAQAVADLEEAKFEYERRRWREQLAMDVQLRLVDARLVEYALLWSYVELVSTSRKNSGELTPEKTKSHATLIQNWRYSKGGLLAGEITRDAAYNFQVALWDYDGRAESYSRIREARWLLRAALRADMGLGTDSAGETLFDAAEKMQEIKSDLRQRLGVRAVGERV